MHSILLLAISLLVLAAHSEFPKIFWMYWESGLSGHPYIRMFDDHHRRMVEKDGWEVRTLNKTSAMTYLR